MVRFGLLLLLCFSLIDCTSKKANLAGDEPVEVDDFIESFQVLKLPYLISDTALSRKSVDSFLISKKIIQQFIPDSIYKHDFGKGSNPKFYALGRVPVKDGET